MLPDPVFLGLTKTQWDFINGFANWLAAFGTIGAVIVSLWLALRSSRPNVKLSARLMRLIVERGNRAPLPECLVIRVVNMGQMPVCITAIGWKLGLVKKRYVAQLTETSSLNSPLPVELQHSQEAHWLVSIARPQYWFACFAETILMPGWKISLKTLRIQVYASTGAVFDARPDSTVIDELRKACRGLELVRKRSGGAEPT